MTNNKLITASVVDLTVTAGDENPKDQAVLSPPNRPKFQTWDFTEDGHFIHQATGKALEAPTDRDGKLQSGTILVLAAKSDKPNQKWTYGPPGPEYKIISQQDKTMCIYVKDYFNAGQPVIITKESSDPTQRWFLLPG